MRIAPVKFERDRYWVESATRRGVWHLVDLDDDGKPGCSCHDFMCRDRTCKHITAVQAWVAARRPILPVPAAGSLPA